LIYWLIGVSGAGKTTIGIRLTEYLNKKNIPNYMLDGDEVRAVFDGDLGYSREDRVANIKRVILASYALDRCGITGIVCNISPFAHLRALARKKIAGYNEIYLKKDLSISRETDVKGVYAENLGKTDLVGVEIDFDLPVCPDLIIEVDKESVEESCQKVIQYVESRMINDTKM